MLLHVALSSCLVYITQCSDAQISIPLLTDSAVHKILIKIVVCISVYTNLAQVQRRVGCTFPFQRVVMEQFVSPSRIWDLGPLFLGVKMKNVVALPLVSSPNLGLWGLFRGLLINLVDDFIGSKYYFYYTRTRLLSLSTHCVSPIISSYRHPCLSLDEYQWNSDYLKQFDALKSLQARHNSER